MGAAPEAKVEEKADDKKKDDKKPKKQESAGISKAERDELEKLKNDIIARMKELKEKENPGCLQAAKEDKKEGKKKKLSAEQEAEKKNLEQQIEEYRNKLKSEFGYTNKDIKADPDLNDMLTKLNAMK